MPAPRPDDPLDAERLRHAITSRPNIPAPPPSLTPRRPVLPRAPLVYWPVVVGTAVVAVGCVVLIVSLLQRGRANNLRKTPAEVEIKQIAETPAPPQAILPPRAAPVMETRRERETPNRREPPAPPKVLPPNEDALRQQLLQVPELQLLSDLEWKSLRELETRNERAAPNRAERTRREFLFRARLNSVLRQVGGREGLPLRDGPATLHDAATASLVQTLAQDLRGLGFGSFPLPARKGPAAEKVAALQEWCDANQVERQPAVLPALVHILEAEDAPTRLLLVRELAKVNHPDAGSALAGRAMADLSPEVRQAAIDALRRRPAKQYLPALLLGLRYPWPAVADHAAQALVALDAREAVPRLRELLDRPDPTLPVRDPKTGRTTIRELVRINHPRNCLLCHAAAHGPRDGLMPARHPIPGQPWATAGNDWIRADFVFLREDFSVRLPVKNPSSWPAEQRFDFVVRTRQLPPGETPAAPPASGSYPQREAVLSALRRLEQTGRPGDKETGR
jgi:hypothetical protein